MSKRGKAEGSTTTEGRRRIMASIRGADTRPELLLRSALWRLGVRGWRCHQRTPGGKVDIAFTRWRLAVHVDGSFWHGHPSKWQPGRWEGYWDEKIKRNIARDAAQDQALRDAGWEVIGSGTSRSKRVPKPLPPVWPRHSRRAEPELPTSAFHKPFQNLRRRSVRQNQTRLSREL